MNRREFGSNAATAVIALCAVILTFVVVRHELAPEQAAGPKPEEAANWRSYQPGGHALYPSMDGPTVVLFSDFDCPFCRQFAEVAEQLRSDGVGFNLWFRHFPIVGKHPTAIQAAVAAECAADQGRFRPFHDMMFAEQGEARRNEWARLASATGITDTARFRECLSAEPPMRRVQADLAEGVRLGVWGTPTIVVNGWRYSGVVTKDQFVRAIARPSR